MAGRRTFWTTLAFAIIVVAASVPALAVGIPWSLMRLGLAREYGWSFLRLGHKEISRQINLADRNTRRHPILSGPVMASAGETLHLDYRIMPADDSAGAFNVSVRELFGANHLWSRRFDASATGSAEVELGPDHLYIIRINYTGYLGTATLDWSVE